MPPITYLEFVLAFVLGPTLLAAVAVLATGRWHPAHLVGTALLVGVALAYTQPWDAYLLRIGVWTYDSAVVGRAGGVPYEELLFVAAQAVMTGLWTTLVVRPDGDGASITRRQRTGGVSAGLLVGAVGIGCSLVPSLVYLGAILAWAGPVFALQWGFGWQVLVAKRRSVLLAIAVPTAYLWAADRLAIALDLWVFSAERTTGIAILGLPIEEALFFLVTNAFLVQGLVLLGWLVERGVPLPIPDAIRTRPERME